MIGKRIPTEDSFEEGAQWRSRFHGENHVVTKFAACGCHIRGAVEKTWAVEVSSARGKFCK